MYHRATSELVGETGVQLFVIVFGGKQSDSLNTLRYAKYMEMVASAKRMILNNCLQQQGQHTFTACMCICKSFFGRNSPYKQKIWLEKYLAKSTMNHFDEIKFGGSMVPMYNKIPLNL